MKKLFVTAAALAITASGAFAQQAVLGSGAFSQSESSQGFVGTSVSGAGSIGPGLALSSNVQTMAGTQSSSGAAIGGTVNGIGVLTGAGGGVIGAVGASGAGSTTTTTSNVGIGSTSFSASTGQAGGLAFGGNQNQAFSGSASNAFGGFGVSLN